MKLFSRTTLVALGTAAAVSISPLSAPAFAETPTPVPTTVTVTATPTTSENTSSTGSSEVKTSEINEWIKLITAVIGVLTTILTFSSKLDTLFR
ncbi:hypothetical protein [Corynebacterium pacaense]|uniref:hypothetical protein n=1 Tax=Corynebacterium pacaense TaxID=1816684 RepID=UPI0009BBA732|nr:hypothetical protein [Corynebacterium pacaense]